MRNQAGTWQPFFDAETMTGRIGILEDISVALVNNDMHVCVTDSSGGLWHSIRFFSNAIFTPLGDVKGQTGNPGPIARVSTAQINGELHVCAVDTNGNLWHAIRHTNSWTAFGDVKGQSCNPGAFIDVTAAEVAGELHVVGTTSFFFGSGIWHVIRHADGSWTKFGDVKAQCGNPGLALQLDAAGVNILLYPEDTKSKRAESFRVPDELLPYLLRYLKEIRPRLIGRREHDGFWASSKGCPLSSCRIYDIVRARITAKFGKAMGLHDFRRAAATFIATDAPEKTGLIPGVLQHASSDVSELYNLARSVEASRRFAAYFAKTRSRLRPISPTSEG